MTPIPRHLIHLSVAVAGWHTGGVLMELFGPPSSWPHQDLIAIGTEFTLDLTLAAYCSGAFPMPLNSDETEATTGWWSPLRRGVLPLDCLRVARSLRKTARRYTTTIDQAFPEVLERCADPHRPLGWIEESVKQVYTKGFEAGFVHSVETWDDEGRLVGGLYGVSLWGLFAGESMFHDPLLGRDASKVALMRLVSHLRGRPDGTALLDVQWRTDHLASMGVMEVDRGEYLRRLDAALARENTEWSTERLPGDWGYEQQDRTG